MKGLARPWRNSRGGGVCKGRYVREQTGAMQDGKGSLFQDFTERVACFADESAHTESEFIRETLIKPSAD
ncbi:hypothetical protein PSCICL_35890 [Pseudomonas cichorii]|nr:hypothetical protein PSCICL_35890 [Pseudomonas cichorii]